MKRIREFAEAVANRAGVGFDPTAIIAIIQAIIAMIANCPKPAAAAVRSGQIGLFRRAQIALQLQQSGARRSLQLANAVAEEALHQQRSFQAGPDGSDWCAQMVAEAKAVEAADAE